MNNICGCFLFSHEFTVGKDAIKVAVQPTSYFKTNCDNSILRICQFSNWRISSNGGGWTGWSLGESIKSGSNYADEIGDIWKEQQAD